ncbi:MAG: hypothetical protein GXW99_01410 [Clostridiales bacterium]|nr:hypothetical protein [Clostridiales bacterium]
MLLTLVLVVLLAAVGIELVQIYGKISTAKAQESQISAQVQQQQQANDALQSDLDKADDPDFIQELARNQLGLAQDGERIFYDVSN